MKLGTSGILIGFIVILLAFYFQSLRKNKVTNVVLQSFNYFARPYVPLGTDYHFKEITTLNAWNGSFMSKNTHLWMDKLSAEDQEIFTKAVLHFQSLNKSLEEINVREGDFPLGGSVLQKLKKWKYHLGPEGYGFYGIRGVPVHKWTFEQSRIFFFALGKYLGYPGGQDVNGTLLGYVKSIGYKDNTERPYRQTVDIAYHIDACDVVGLLCIHPAKEGGISRIISTVTVYNQLIKTPLGQKYAAKLSSEILSSVRSTFGLGLKALPVTPFKIDSTGTLRTFWNQEYFLKAYRHGNGSITSFAEKDPLALEAIEAYDKFLQDDMKRGYINRGNCSEVNDCSLQFDYDELGLDMRLEAGDVQLVNNHFVLHARTEFTDWSDEEIENAPKITNLAGEEVSSLGKRELFRLWLSQSTEDLSWGVYLSKQRDLLNVCLTFVRALLYFR